MFMLTAVAGGLVVAAFITSAVLCLLVRRISPRIGFVDRPGGHKGHREPTPLGGGVAIWLTTAGILGLGILIVGRWGATGFPDALARHSSGIMLRSGSLWLILALSTVIMLMGLVDDWKTLDWRLRLGIQVSCAVALAVGGVRVTLFGPFTHPLLGGAVTVLWVVGLTNSFNMLDNMDGLAASVGLIVAVLFCGAELAVEQPLRAGRHARRDRGAGRLSGSQPLPCPALHGRRGQQLPRVPAGGVRPSPEPSPAMIPARHIRRTACSRRCSSWRCRFTT